MNIEKKLNQNSGSEAPNWATQDSAFYGRTVKTRPKKQKKNCKGKMK